MNFATVFAASCLTLSVAIPGGLYLAGKAQNQFSGNGSAATSGERLWIATPTFTLIDGKGERHHMVAAVGTGSKEDVARLCKYLPIVRDRLQRFASAVRIVGPGNGQPKLSGSPDLLAEELAGALGFSRQPDVRIVNSEHPVEEVIRAKFETCQTDES